MTAAGKAPVIVYCGHMFSSNCAEEPALAQRISAALDDLGSMVAYGPLACGADILIAEAMLARGGELNIALPFAEADFIAESVTSGGEDWLPRYHACMAAADGVHFATQCDFVNDDNQFAYGTRFAMGLAALRANADGVDAVQLAVRSDSIKRISESALAGTDADVSVWERLGNRTVAVESGPVTRQFSFPPRRPVHANLQREVRSIIFADYKGFSRLGERELPLFMDEVMGRIGDTLDSFGDAVEYRNSWGDAIYVIVDTPATAARIALALQERIKTLPDELTPHGAIAGMRLGLHFGPIYKGQDRVTGTPLWYGGEVNRTARIEPVTPVGGVYCTENFASALLLDRFSDARFTSVGKQQLAKNYGEIELFRLDGLDSVA